MRLAWELFQITVMVALWYLIRKRAYREGFEDGKKAAVEQD